MYLVILSIFFATSYYQMKISLSTLLRTFVLNRQSYTFANLCSIFIKLLLTCLTSFDMILLRTLVLFSWSVKKKEGGLFIDIYPKQIKKKNEDMHHRRYSGTIYLSDFNTAQTNGLAAAQVFNAFKFDEEMKLIVQRKKEMSLGGL